MESFETMFAIFFVLLIYAAVGLISLVYYVLYSLSLMKLASAKGVDNAWLAWLPVGNAYVLGATADRLEERRGISHKWGKLLVILNLVIGVLFAVAFIALFAFIAYVGIAEASGMFYDESILIAPFLGIYFTYVGIMVVAMVVRILAVICAYKIFEEIDPKKSVKYILLYLLVPFGDVFCFFRCKNKAPYADLMQAESAPETAPATVTPEVTLAEKKAEPVSSDEVRPGGEEPSPELVFGYDTPPSQEEEKTNDEEKNHENDQQ